MLRFFGFLFVLALIVLGVGVFLGWFQIGTVEGGGRTGVHVGVDTERIERDAREAGEKLRALADRVVSGTEEAADEVRSKIDAADRVVEGTLVEVSGRQLLVRVGDAESSYAAEDTTLVYLDGDRVALSDLRAGDRVELAVGDGGEGDRVLLVHARRGA